MEEALLSLRAFDPSTVVPKVSEFVKHSVEGRAAKAARTEGGSDELPTTLCLEAFSETVGAQISGNRVGQLKVLYDEFQRNFAWSSVSLTCDFFLQYRARQSSTCLACHIVSGYHAWRSSKNIFDCRVILLAFKVILP